jgi:hypothetical protein
MEFVVGEMIDAGDWGSLCFWQGQLSEAVAEYLLMAGRANQAICEHCWENLGEDLRHRLKGKVSIERRE